MLVVRVGSAFPSVVGDPSYELFCAGSLGCAIPGPEKGGIGFPVRGCCSPWASEGWDQFSTTLVFQHVVQHMVLMGLCGNMGNGHQDRPQL